MQHGQHVSELRKLTGVTSLMLGYGGSDLDEVDSTLQGLAAVTQLQELTVYLHTEELAMRSVLPLTSLTALTDLQIWCNRPYGAGSDLDGNESDMGSESDDLVLGVCLKKVSQLTCDSLAVPFNMSSSSMSMLCSQGNSRRRTLHGSHSIMFSLIYN
jgi:hypothetical protein